MSKYWKRYLQHNKHNMVTIDQIIRLIAPQQCIACGNEGSVLCEMCLLSAGGTVPPRCAGCRAISKSSKTCKSCRSWLNVSAVYVAAEYDGIYEGLIQEYKFHVKRDTVRPLAQIMKESVVILPEQTVVCPVPTAPSRIRQRGFDHAKLLAQTLAGKIDRPYECLLARKTNVRQLGASRKKRIEQMKQEFYVRKYMQVDGKVVLLVDDVMTTGASIAGAAKILREAGAKKVLAAVFAQKL